MLGNSTCGLSPKNECILYRACVVPIAMYGHRLWFYKGAKNVGTLKTLSSMQRKAAIWITGAFCTSPTGGSELLAGLPLVGLSSLPASLLSVSICICLPALKYPLDYLDAAWLADARVGEKGEAPASEIRSRAHLALSQHPARRSPPPKVLSDNASIPESGARGWKIVASLSGTPLCFARKPTTTLCNPPAIPRGFMTPTSLVGAHSFPNCLSHQPPALTRTVLPLVHKPPFVPDGSNSSSDDENNGAQRCSGTPPNVNRWTSGYDVGHAHLATTLGRNQQLRSEPLPNLAQHRHWPPRHGLHRHRHRLSTTTRRRRTASQSGTSTEERARELLSLFRYLPQRRKEVQLEEGVRRRALTAAIDADTPFPPTSPSTSPPPPSPKPIAAPRLGYTAPTIVTTGNQIPFGDDHQPPSSQGLSPLDNPATPQQRGRGPGNIPIPAPIAGVFMGTVVHLPVSLPPPSLILNTLALKDKDNTLMARRTRLSAPHRMLWSEGCPRPLHSLNHTHNARIRRTQAFYTYTFAARRKTLNQMRPRFLHSHSSQTHNQFEHRRRVTPLARRKRRRLLEEVLNGSSMNLKRVKGENFYRDAKAASRLKMLNGGKAVRDKDGKIIKAAAFQKGEDETLPGRVQPDRRWFGNTRVISQTALDHFRTSLGAKKDDPYSVLLRRNKLPMALLDDAQNPHTRKRPHIVETESFSDTFGPKAQRKRPRIEVGSFEELSKAAEEAIEESQGTTSIEQLASEVVEEPTHADYHEPIYAKGTSRRIYGELYKVIDSSDVILHVLDARDPMGTLCQSVLDYIKKEKSHKQVVLVINKCDLVPNWVTARYIQHLTPRYPTIAFHASPNHSFGKGTLIQLLRQFAQLHSDKKQISVGFMGYPNVGKSSVINTLKSGKVCTVAPVPGETKVWKYITLTRRIYLIDCPGIVPTSANDTETATVLKGVVRVEALPTPSDHIPELMQRVKPIYLSRTYGIPLPNPNDPSEAWKPEDLLDKMARMKGRLLKHGEPDREAVSKIILSDWVRGRIPFFVTPPERSEELNAVEAKKRKVADAKGKAKAVEENDSELHVKQNLKTLMQKNTFVPEDIQPLDEEDDGDAEGDEDAEGELESDEEVADEEDEEDELKWNDVFEGVGASEEPSEGAPPSDSGDENEDEEEAAGGEEGVILSTFGRTKPILQSSLDEADVSDEETKPEKEARMKTSKKKAENFYSKANVKNKNRSKAALLRSLPVGKRAERKQKQKK
ncbi:hypothetical protein NMY22_g7255 [Coprinellus aureogranulatus]|nr:hypothetical protein NMY22_g7255 [Coprinellus aureogranulatus]